MLSKDLSNFFCSLQEKLTFVVGETSDDHCYYFPLEKYVRTDVPNWDLGFWCPITPHGVVDIKALPGLKYKLAGYCFWLSYVFSETND